MILFSAHPEHLGSCEYFEFRVKWDRYCVAGVSIVSGRSRRTKPDEHRGGGDEGMVRSSSGPKSYKAITLERGIIHDPEFE